MQNLLRQSLFRVVISCGSGTRTPKDADQSHTETGTCHMSLDHSSREPQGSWKQIRSQVECEAHEILKGSPSHEHVCKFLQRVPWHVVQLRKERHRSTLQGIQRKHGRPNAYVIFGMFTHGGVNGLTRVTREYPGVAKCLALAVKTGNPDQEVTSISITCNTKSLPHRDVFNMQERQNLIIPLVRPNHGGELWLAGPFRDGATRRVVKYCNDKPYVGYLYPLNAPMSFDPKQWHATQAWSGDRVMLIGYALQGFSRLDPRDDQHLKGLGFPVPHTTSTCAKPVLKVPDSFLIPKHPCRP